MYHFLVSEDSEDSRVDAFLHDMLGENFSRNQIQKAIKAGNLKISGKVVTKVATRLEKNQKIFFVPLKEESLPSVEAENIPLNILYENDDMMVILKPSGMCVHPDHCYRSGTVVNALLHYFKGENLSSLGGAERPGIVHRLDKDTSGCLMIAKNDKMHKYLSTIISERKVTKKYSALVFGRIKVAEGSIDAPMIRNPHDRQKMCVLDDTRAKPALTHFTVQAIYPEPLCTLLDVQIITGRTHQIRVHFESIGRPIVGDPLYGRVRENEEFFTAFPLNRIFLHAREISLPLPNGEILEVIAPFPEDLEKTFGMLDTDDGSKF